MPSPESSRLRKTLAYPAVLGALIGGSVLFDSKSAEAKPLAEAGSSLPERLVFASNRAGHYQIYLKNLVTKKLVNLSQNKSNDMNPQASPDGEQLVFYSDRSGNNQIYELEIDHPKNITRLTHNNADDYDPVYMPDGRILFKSDLQGDKGLGDIWIMDSDGSNPRNLTPHTPHTEDWKPEPISNSEIIYTTRATHGDSNSDDLFRLNIKTGVKTRLTNNQVPDWFPSYSPANGQVVFISNSKLGAKDDIYVMSADGNGRTNITKKLHGDSDDPAWSPDGKSITFLNKDTAGYGIYVMNKDGSNAKPLDTSPSGDNLSPSFIPQK